eukprot:UN14845
MVHISRLGHGARHDQQKQDDVCALGRLVDDRHLVRQSHVYIIARLPEPATRHSADSTRDVSRPRSMVAVCIMYVCNASEP